MSRESRDELIAAIFLAFREQQTATELLDEAAWEVLGVNRTDGRCLDVIEREGSVTAGRLAAVAGLSSGAVTTAIDRLERAGLARRTADPGDRRKVLVELTESGADSCDRIYGPLNDEGVEALADYSERDLKTLRDFFVLGRELLEAHTERVRAIAPRRDPVSS
jgi:DNA-binding MarR family transcriptional regulator